LFGLAPDAISGALGYTGFGGETLEVAPLGLGLAALTLELGPGKGNVAGSRGIVAAQTGKFAPLTGKLAGFSVGT